MNKPKSSKGISAAVADILKTSVSLAEGDMCEQPTLPLIETGADAEGMALAKGARSGPGRPKGSKNKSSEEWAEHILNQYRSPLIFLAETYNRPVGLLAAELKCDRLEAFKIQLAAAKDLAPYVHQKQPQALDLGGEKGLVPLVLGISADFSGASVMEKRLVNMKVIEAPIEAVQHESEQNQ
ncbi:MAG: hypothetical protein L3J58_11705 [Emcibacter sp.]|nr:hypothetical protein [Emcibacter sp.]